MANPGKSKIKQFLTVAYSLVDILNGVQNGISSPSKLREGIVLFNIIKFKKTLRSVILLTENGLNYDACMLSRTLFEILLTLQYIFKPGEDTEAILVQWLNFDKVSRLGKVDKIKELHDSPKKFFEYAEKKYQDFDKYIQSLRKDKANLLKIYGSGYKKTWFGKNIAAAAGEVGLSNKYATFYAMSSEFIHNDPIIANFYITNDSTGRIFEKVGEDFDTGIVSAVAFGLKIINVCIGRIKIDKITQKKFKKSASKFVKLMKSI